MTLLPIQSGADKLSCFATNKNDETNNPISSPCTCRCKRQFCILKKLEDKCINTNKRDETGLLTIDFEVI